MNRDQAIEIICSSALGNDVNTLSKLLKPSVRIIVRDGTAVDYSQVTSRFGGVPLAPPGFDWPAWDNSGHQLGQIAHFQRNLGGKPPTGPLKSLIETMSAAVTHRPLPLGFLGQIVLSELHSSASLIGWPDKGILSFFYAAAPTKPWGFDPLERGGCRIFYWCEDERLEIATPPADLSPEAAFPERRINFESDWTLPTFMMRKDVDVSPRSSPELRELFKRLMGGPPIHRFSGHPQEIQNEMRLQCQLVTNGIYRGNSSTAKDPRVSEFQNGAGDWTLLLQIDSDERLNWTWGDAGRIYFWIRKQDIESLNFRDAWAILQCY